MRRPLAPPPFPLLFPAYQWWIQFHRLTEHEQSSAPAQFLVIDWSKLGVGPETVHYCLVSIGVSTRGQIKQVR